MSEDSPKFDREYYLRTYPDVALSGRDPAEHYFEIGWKEGRDPSETFSTAGYLAANPDVAAAEVNPLQHFLTSGLAEGRAGWRKGIAEDRGRPEPVWGIDREYYLRTYPDVALSGRDPAEHYFEIGWKEGRDPSETFSTAGYLAANPDVAAAEVNPLQHFLTSGLAEGRTGWRKRSAEDGDAPAAWNHDTAWGRTWARREYKAPIPLTPRALRIFARVTQIARSQPLV
ncbi:serralysin [Methylobacterium sp. UNC378MF]|uniref:hypothetical protein n=1 Tax=Methylobacterium sp. UNC378MF TaxID=1502748 RepID=UPI00087E5EB3|nr:hypothetical protein [Methylobacterium sp. UNC378MF]SDA34562.1 serralysin [Methylobacterium sp. UNC378MF]